MFGIQMGQMARGTVVKVRRYDGAKALEMLFDVEVDGSGLSTGGDPSTLENVVLLVPSFQALTHREPAPGGMLGIPEVGTRVLCIHDGVRWCIFGCYTGPTASAKVNSMDKANSGQSAVTYNAGVGAAARPDQQSVSFDLPSWDFGAAEGDLMMSRGVARVKVMDIGVLIGADVHASTIYKKDGEAIRTSATETVRHMGYSRVQTYSLGRTPTWLPDPLRAVGDAVTAFSYRAEVIEASPLYRSRKAFVIHQRGCVADSVLNDGRASVAVQPSSLDVASPTFVAIRDAVVQPNTISKPDPSVPELDTSAATMYDYQVDNDGSFRLRAGNLGNKPLAQTRKKHTLDFEMAYDAVTGGFSIKVGKAGVSTAAVTIDGIKGVVEATALLRARLAAGKPGVPSQSYIEVTPAYIILNAPLVKIPNRVEYLDVMQLVVEQNASVGQDLQVGQTASAGTVVGGVVVSEGIELAKHKHNVGMGYGAEPPGTLNETTKGF